MYGMSDNPQIIKADINLRLNKKVNQVYSVKFEGRSGVAVMKFRKAEPRVSIAELVSK